jgi:hypothetical protein
MGIELMPSGREAEITGGLPAGCAREFRDIIAHAPTVNVLHVNNTGGRVYEALNIAKIVTARGMTTYISVECESAATVIFLAGRERYVANGAKVGFHAGSFPGMLTSQLFELNAGVREAMLTAGVNADFIERALATPPTEMWYPSVDEMIQAGVVTGITHGERFGISPVVARHIEKSGLDEISPSFSYLKKLREIDPDMYANMVRAFHEGVAAGLSEGDIGANVRKIVIAKVALVQLRASDEALRHMMRLWISLLEKYKDTQPKEVLQTFGGQVADDANSNLSIGRVLPDYPIAEEGEVIVELMASAAREERPIDKEQASQDLSTVAKVLNQKAPNAISILVADQKQVKDYRTTANAFWFYYTTIRDEVPRSHQANLLRYMLK